MYQEFCSDVNNCLSQMIFPFEQTGPTEMINYPLLMTPPMSSEDSQSPQSSYPLSPHSSANTPPHIFSPQYTFNNMTLQDTENKPYLHIIEQPVDRFRFRYKSEMAGTHGCLNGQKTSSQSERTKKQTYPTVQLKNYKSNAIVRCSLYQYNDKMEDLMLQPHAHRLVQKNGNGIDEVDDPHDLYIGEKTNFIARFQNMGIIHTARKFLQPELERKQTKLRLEAIRRTEGVARELKVAEEVEIKKFSAEVAKTMNLNTVCLRFDAFNEVNGALHYICEPIFSHPINNLKSALTGELKIARMDHCTSPADGGKEIYLLVEKVTKKNIRIKFYELDDDESVIWCDYGKFTDLDVHHQYAIVFTTPRYRDVGIEKDRRVFIELERPTDGSTSEPRDFTYYPVKHSAPGSKRSRPSNSSSYSWSSGDLPTILPEPQLFDSGNIEKFKANVGSEEFNRLLSSDPELKEMFQLTPVAPAYPQELFCTYGDGFNPGNISTQCDGPCQIPTHDASSKAMQWESSLISKTDRDKISRVCMELVSFMKTKPPDFRAIQMMQNVFNDYVNDEKNNPLHLAILSCNTNINDAVNLLLHLVTLLKLNHFLDIQNKNGETPIHLAVKYNKQQVVDKLISLNVNIGVKDERGNTALHHSVMKNSYKSLVKAKDIEDCINLENNDGYTALQMAVKTSNFDAVKILCQAGADVNIIDKRNGCSVLHTAIQEQSTPIVEYLLEFTEVNIDAPDYNGSTAHKLAKIMVQNGKDESQRICQILESKLTKLGIFFECDIKEEIESDSDEMEIDCNYDVDVSKLSSEELEELYAKITEFDSDVISEMATILDVNGKWKKLAKLLDLDHLLRTNLFDNSASPTRTLVSCAMTSGDSIYSIRTCLSKLGELKAVNVLDNLAMSFKNNESIF